MNFYEMDDATWDTKGFAFASGYGPLPESIPFLHPVFLERRLAFWKVNPMGPGLYIEPEGKKWPDFLGNGHSPPMFFVSERVVASLHSLGAPIARVTEMPIAEIKSKALKLVPPPKYFVVESRPGIKVDFVASNFPTDAEGKPIVNPPPKPWPQLKVSADSWNGTDLFDYSNFGAGPYLNLFCTEKVKDLAKKEGWTNVRFKPIEVA